MEYAVSGFDQPATVGENGMVKFGSDSRLNVVFYTRVVQDVEESRRRGMPFSKSMTYVRIQVPGERDNVDRPVKENDDAIGRFPAQWNAFQQGKKPVPSGTPIEVLFPQHPEVAANLHSLGVHTVQQLANLTAYGIDTIGMGAGMWKQKAVEFLKAAEGSAGYHKMEAENEKLRNSLEVQGNQMSLMRAQLDALLAERKGVPPAMIPTIKPTTAQASFVDDPEPLEGGSASSGLGDAPQSSGDPLFDEPEESYGDASAPVNVPKRRGRPPKIHN